MVASFLERFVFVLEQSRDLVRCVRCVNAVDVASIRSVEQEVREICNVIVFNRRDFLADFVSFYAECTDDAGKRIVRRSDDRKHSGGIGTKIGIADFLGVFFEGIGVIISAQIMDAKIDAFVRLSDFCVGATDDDANGDNRNECNDASGDEFDERRGKNDATRLDFAFDGDLVKICLFIHKAIIA